MICAPAWDNARAIAAPMPILFVSGRLDASAGAVAGAGGVALSLLLRTRITDLGMRP